MGSTYPSYLKKLITLQNKVVKMIGGGIMQDSPTQFCSALKILKLIDLHKLEIGKMVHAQLQNKLPFKLSNCFIQSSNISQKITRYVWKGSKTLYIPQYSTERLQRCIKYQGVKTWNEIPLEIQTTSIKMFKKIQR